MPKLTVSAISSARPFSVRRISAGLAFTKLGRDRLVFRHESAAREQVTSRGLSVETDRVGNTIAWWEPECGSNVARREEIVKAW